MTKKIKLITFDLDDTLWDNMPTITRAEIDTRKWIEDRVGKIEWGSFEDFLHLREELILEDESIKWDISKLRKEIFRRKINHVEPEKFKNDLVNNAFNIFIKKRHEVILFDGVETAIKELSKKYQLGILTNGNADIFKFDIGKYFNFSISCLEAKDSKPNRSHFDKAKEITKINFNEMLHIGDHQINDIFGAFNLGIETLWFNNNNEKWNQNFAKPLEFSDWNNLVPILRNNYE
tara:strand:- start:19137 stop:19838 length:702 start_codon:yes stop_codon:yes gene_type:complete